MEYEEIKVGDVFRYIDDEETVISKSDKYRIITTIDSETIPTTWAEESLHYLKPIKEELPEEGLLVSERGSIVYRTGKKSGYGFDFNKNYKIFNDDSYDVVGWSFNSFSEDWRKATEADRKEWLAKLTKEAKGRYKKGDLLKSLTTTGTHTFDGSRLTIDERNDTLFDGGVAIMTHGKWAKVSELPKEESTLTQVAKAVQEIEDFAIEQTKSGVIILTPIKK